MTSRILSSWFIVDEPGKMGFPVNSSPRMHPAQYLHINQHAVQSNFLYWPCGVKDKIRAKGECLAGLEPAVIPYV